MTDEETPKSGHNLPEFDPKTVVDLEILADQLRATYAHLFVERDKYVTNSNKWLEAHPKGVENDEEEAALTEKIASLLAICDAYHGKPKSAHTLAKEPFLKGGRIVDAVLNTELAGGLNGVLDRLKKPLKEYKDAKVKRLREEQAEAVRKAAEQAAAEAAKLNSGSGDLEAALAAEQASLDAVAEIESGKVSIQSQARGDLGALSGLRGKWKARVTNPSLIPRQFMMPNQAAIDLHMSQSRDKKTGVPSVNIPGVVFEQETSLSIRR